VSKFLTFAVAFALSPLATGAQASVRCTEIFSPKIQGSNEISAGIHFGEKLVHELRMRLENLRKTHPQDFVFENSGSERMQQMRAKTFETTLKRMQQLRSGNFRIAVAANVKMRAEILKFGLKNLHQTNATFGRNDVSLRNTVESHLAGLPLEQYTQLPAEFKPKYGFLRFENDGDFPWLAAPP